MSDGPHRSLNLRPGWKKVAELADNQASAPEDVCDVAGPALAQDWDHEVSDRLVSTISAIVGGEQESLFADHDTSRLEALRPMTAGHELGQLFLDCAIKATAEGRSGQDALVGAAEESLSVWSVRHARAVEEHFLRETSESRARNVRGRIEEALANACGTEFARKLLKIVDERAPKRSPKKSGLDDGVDL